MPFGKKQQQPHIENNVPSKENQMKVDSTSIKEVTSIPWVESMKKGMVPKRVITVGYNGNIKRNVTPEGMLKDMKQKILDRENKMMRTFPVSCKGLFKNHNGVSRALRFEIISDRWNVYMTLPNVLSWKEKNIWDITRRNPFMNWNKPWDGGI